MTVYTVLCPFAEGCCSKKTCSQLDYVRGGSRCPVSRKQPSVLRCLAVCLVLAGCRPHTTPKLIEADGATYIACRDLVWVTGKSGLLSGETTYEVSFSDSEGTGHHLYGVKRLTMTDGPKAEFRDYPFPSGLPDPKTGTDNTGKPYKEGLEYTWPDGSRAILKNGQWEHVKYWYDPCKPGP